MHWIDLEGAVNIRDVGGIPTEDGGSTLRGRLLRGDNLQDLSPADVTYLVTTLGLRTVVDLRTPGEVGAEGPAPLTRVAHVAHVHHSLLPERGRDGDTAAALLARRERTAARYPGNPACASYLGYVEERPESIVGALRAITDSPGATLVHCAAGKDRTGVVVALALTVAGARREQIVRDYAASGSRIDAIIDRLRSSDTYAEDVDRLPPDKHRPRPETMSEFLEQFEVRYGGVPSWLTGHGFLPAEMARLRAKLRT